MANPTRDFIVTLQYWTGVDNVLATIPWSCEGPFNGESVKALFAYWRRQQELDVGHPLLLLNLVEMDADSSANVAVGASVCARCEGSYYVEDATCPLCFGLGSQNIKTPRASGDPPPLVRMALSLLAQGSGEQSPEYETFWSAITRAGYTVVDHGQVITTDPGIRGGTDK